MSDQRDADLSDVSLITPAYNEEEALPSVLAALAPLREQGLEVIVVDDGSTDGTSRVAGQSGVEVVRLQRNVGKAGAVRAGLDAAARTKIVLIDADATYPVDVIPEFGRLLDDYDVVLGARTAGRIHIPAVNRFGNAALRTIIQWFSGFGSVDPLTGLFGIRREHLAAMDVRSRGFGLEAEMAVKAARMGLRWIDVPITYSERIGTSKLRPVQDGLIITWTVVRTLFSGPRTVPARGRADRLRPAALAIATTALSLALLTVAAIVLGVAAILSLAALVEPTIPLTTAVIAPGVLTLGAAVMLWRLVTRWGRPGPALLAPLALGATAGGALLVGAGVVVADAVGVLHDAARHAITARALLIAAALALIASPLAYVLALRAPSIRNQLEDAIGSVARPTTRGELLALGAILFFFLVPVTRYIAVAPIFGFDESIYANTARAWLEGTPNTGWSAHRSPGISLLGLPAVSFAAEWAFRLVGLLAGACCVVMAWALGRRLHGPSAGLIAAVVAASVPELLVSSSLFLTDVPSAGLVMLLMLVLWRELEVRTTPSRSLLWTAPIAAAAFYVRYGAAVPIMLVGVTALILWHRKLLAAWKRSSLTVGLLLILLLPHLVQATLMTGTPWGIARMAQNLAASGSPMDTLLSFLRLTPHGLAGIVAESLILLALLAWPVLIVRGGGLRDGAARMHTYLLLPAVGQFLLISLVAMAHVRYILLPILLIVVAGSAAAVRLAQPLTPPSRQAFAIVIVVAAVVAGLGTAAVEVRGRAAYAPTQYDLVDAARRVRDDAGDASCAILGYPPPQITWYSGCATRHFGYPPVAGRSAALNATRRYLILPPGEGDRYPSGDLREEYLAEAEPQPFAVIHDRVTGDPAFEVYRLPNDR